MDLRMSCSVLNEQEGDRCWRTLKNNVVLCLLSPRTWGWQALLNAEWIVTARYKRGWGRPASHAA